MAKLTHLDDEGQARMVDVGAKDVTRRVARAEVRVAMAPATAAAIRDSQLKKGDALGTARIAGIQAAKQTHLLIPLAHPLPLDRVTVEFAVEDDGVRIATAAAATARTGVELEAMTAAAVAALTIYDMAKAIDRGMEIGALRLLSKTGGKSGDWERS